MRRIKAGRANGLTDQNLFVVGKDQDFVAGLECCLDELLCEWQLCFAGLHPQL